MEKIPNTAAEQLRHEAHAYLQMFQGDATPLAKCMYDRGMADPEDAVRIYTLCKKHGLGVSHFFDDRSPERDQMLVDTLEQYLAKTEPADLEEQTELAQKFGELIKNKE